MVSPIRHLITFKNINLNTFIPNLGKFSNELVARSAYLDREKFPKVNNTS